MKKPLKILILEDSLEDAEMITRILKKEGLAFEHCIATDRAEYERCLDEYDADVILSDNSLPQFNAMEALAMIRSRSQHIPFILVTGTVSEEFAAGIIKLGADDYILKDRLTRLPSAIENALRQRRSEKDKTEAVENLKLSEENLSAIFSNTSEAFILTDRYCVIKTFNGNAKKYVLMNSGDELVLGLSIFRFVSSDRATFMKENISRVLGGEKVEYERGYQKNGEVFVWIYFSITPVWKDGSIDGICITASDITPQKKAEETQRTMERAILDEKVQAQKSVARAIIKAQESERNRIGQELHDNVNQILAGTKMFLSSAGRSDAKLESLIRYPMELIDRCMAEIRMLSQKQVTPLKDIDLKDLIGSLLDELEKNSQIKTGFRYDINKDIGDDLKLNIYRIIQEQLNNIVKHAMAGHVDVVLEETETSCRIMVRDNGQGFDVTRKRKGVGISNMINRIELFNGEVQVESAPGEGCKVQIVVPNCI